MIKMKNTCNTKELNAFNKKLTAANLKKLLKCSEVIDLYDVNCYAGAFKSISNIDEDAFYNLINELSDFDIEAMAKISSYSRKKQKYFIFSDEFNYSLLAIEKLKDLAAITFFELDEDGVDMFIENIKCIKSNFAAIESLNQAREMFGNLQDFENEFGISLTISGADDEIYDKKQELEKETEEASEQIGDLLSWS